MSTSQLNTAGDALTKEWIEADKEVNRLAKLLSDAKAREAVAAKKLTVFIAPKDAANYEKFQFWFGDRMMQVTYRNDGEHTVNFRK